MELRHLRYFVAVAEQRGFAPAARRLRVAQPALSKQIRDLEAEVGVALFQRLPRGVRLTVAGEAFLADARSTLEAAARAIGRARGAAEDRASSLTFAHGEVAVFAPAIEQLLAAFRDARPEVLVRVASESDDAIYDSLREQRVDVGCVFLARWPLDGFGVHRLVSCPVTGVLLPARHPLAAQSAVHLADLSTLTWLHSAPQRWPGFFRTLEQELRDRGLAPQRQRERSQEAPAANMQIAAGDAWTLVSEAVAAPYRAGSAAIVYRPIVEPPIPCWLALVWLPSAGSIVHCLVDVARRLGLTVGDDDSAARVA